MYFFSGRIQSCVRARFYNVTWMKQKKTRGIERGESKLTKLLRRERGEEAWRQRFMNNKARTRKET
jgi:hypothetical protein